MDKSTVEGSRAEQRLYELIWKRTIASQMSEAQLEKTTITIAVSGATESFIATGEVLKFDGFLKVYMESTDDNQEEEAKGLLPAVSVKDILKRELIEATEKNHPASSQIYRSQPGEKDGRAGNRPSFHLRPHYFHSPAKGIRSERGAPGQ